MTVSPGNDPYSFTNNDTLGAFRFSAQYMKDAGKLKTYVYHDAKNRYVLIHAAEYQVSDCRLHQAGFGINRVYSAKFEKEFTFQCHSVCP
jgi:hypothetical protein